MRLESRLSTIISNNQNLILNFSRPFLCSKMAHRGASPNQLDVNLISIGKVLAKFQRYWCLQKDTIYERKVPQGCKNESKKSTNSMFWLFDMIVLSDDDVIFT